VYPGEAAVSWEEALARVEGDRELLAEMAALFLESGHGLLAAIREAIDRQDARGLEHAAHDLKSSVGNFGAHTAREAALSLEKMGRAGDLARAEEAYRSLERSMQQLWPVLEAMQGSEEVS
jgi:HPt (histidine-containing phosphotransfer) domain-containing protein